MKRLLNKRGWPRDVGIILQTTKQKKNPGYNRNTVVLDLIERSSFGVRDPSESDCVEEQEGMRIDRMAWGRMFWVHRAPELLRDVETLLSLLSLQTPGLGIEETCMLGTCYITLGAWTQGVPAEECIR